VLACFHFPGLFKFLKKIFPTTTTKFFKEGNRVCILASRGAEKERSEKVRKM